MTDESRTNIEKDFLDALRRLDSGVPIVVNIPKNGGRIPINFSTVAREARHSRTLIGTKDCAYPNIRNAILKSMHGDTEIVDENLTRNSRRAETTDELKQENRRLNSVITDLASRLAVSDDIVVQLQKALAREEERSSRNRSPP